VKVKKQSWISKSRIYPLCWS